MSLPHFGILKDKKEKNWKRDKRIAKSTTLLVIFFEHVIGRGSNLVNLVSLRIYDERSHLRCGSMFNRE